MKRAFQLGRRARGRCPVHRLVATAAGLAVGFTYCRAARLDEERGFPLTAALEWRKAAGLLAPFSSLSDRCWVEWERIMCLPRWLAAPVGDATIAPVLIALEAELPREHPDSDPASLPLAA